MAQKSIELILFRQLAYYLATPMFIMDERGKIIFCNEAAEKILGFKFSETGEMSSHEWSTIFMPQDQQGNPITKPISHHTISGDKFYLKNIQNRMIHVEQFSFPIINEMNTYLGTVIFLQETKA